MAGPRQPPNLILASASPRRRQLLSDAGYAYEAIDPPFVEPDDAHPHVAPSLHAESLAFFKASSVASSCPDRPILGADTIAAYDGRIIGKPRDEEDAFRILSSLSGTSHSVITGIVLVHHASGKRLLQHDVSTVVMRKLSDEAIRAYLRSGAWHGKAGAYGVQDEDDPFVEEVIGSFTNVVGLPMELLERMFETWLRD